MMTLFVEYPLLAAALGVLFLALYRVWRLRAVAFAAGAWLVYGAYEVAMDLRLLCTGECNIRVDLLLIYPVLLVITIVATVSLLLRLARRQVH